MESVLPLCENQALLLQNVVLYVLRKNFEGWMLPIYPLDALSFAEPRRKDVSSFGKSAGFCWQ
jgi:hypothetical protein